MFWMLPNEQEGRRGECAGSSGGTVLRTLGKGLGGGGRPVPIPELHPSPHTPSLCCLPSYGRVYAAADPYHHTIGPAATYSIGTMVRRPGRRALGTGRRGREGRAGP